MTVLGDPLWAELLSLTNILFGSFLGVICLIASRRNRGYYRILLTALGLIGLYWAGIYVYVFVTPANTPFSVFFGQVFVRPAFTLTLAVLASIAVYQWRARRG